MDDFMSLEKPLVVLGCSYLSWEIIKHISSFPKLEKEPVTILITGAAGHIGYALVPMIARGAMLGPDQPVIIHLLDNEATAEALNAVKMELVDAAFPLLKGVVATSDVVEAWKGVNIAILLGGYRWQEKMERKDVLSKNVSIYKSQALALDQHAAPDCKVLVVANPANINALLLKRFAPSIPKKNITCLTRLDHNRALAQISEKLNIHISDVRNVIIWGNHYSTLYPDANHATVYTGTREKPAIKLIDDDKWLKTGFIEARKMSSALSIASSACDHIRDWILGTPKGTWVSMGVCSDGSYGIPQSLFYSFPVTCDQGEWSIVQGLRINKFVRKKMDANLFSRKKMDANVKELLEEISLA